MRATSSNGVDMPVVQLAAHARSSTLYVQLYAQDEIARIRKRKRGGNMQLHVSVMFM